jgi:hypothetical protein
MTKLATMTPTTPDALEDFAYTLGEHTQKFADHPQYKTFVKELLTDLCANLKPDEVIEVRNHIDRLATQRAKEERSGNVTHFIQKSRESSDSDNDASQYMDFM